LASYLSQLSLLLLALPLHRLQLQVLLLRVLL
jgi:hypothetical protein